MLNLARLGGRFRAIVVAYFSIFYTCCRRTFGFVVVSAPDFVDGWNAKVQLVPERFESGSVRYGRRQEDSRDRDGEAFHCGPLSFRVCRTFQLCSHSERHRHRTRHPLYADRRRRVTLAANAVYRYFKSPSAAEKVFAKSMSFVVSGAAMSDASSLGSGGASAFWSNSTLTGSNASTGVNSARPR